MAKYQVLYTDSSMKDIEIEKRILAEIDAEVLMASGTDAETLIREGMHCIGIMNEYAPIPASVLEAWARCGQVRCIGKQGIGVDTIDIEAANRCGIMVANVPDYCIDEVSDHSVALALAALRQLKSFDRMINGGDWQEIPTRPMHRMRGRHCGIYGFGNIARVVANKMQTFGFETATYDPYIPEAVCEAHHTKKVASLGELAAFSDVMMIHVPLLPATRHSINASVFRQMKRGTVLVNAARGSVICESELIDALDCGVVGGAGLDVFENEPLQPGSPLRNRDNVILTPHVAYYSEEAETELRTKLAKNIADAIVKGEPTYFYNRKGILIKE